MAKYLHLYETEADFISDYYGQSYHEPWVSAVKQTGNVAYNKEIGIVRVSFDSGATVYSAKTNVVTTQLLNQITNNRWTSNEVGDVCSLVLEGNIVMDSTWAGNVVISDSMCNEVTFPDSATNLGRGEGCYVLVYSMAGADVKEIYVNVSRNTTYIGSSFIMIGDEKGIVAATVTISFDGTMAQWNSIEKDNDWAVFAAERSVYVQCTDGTIVVVYNPPA